jgi:hypothetical protein
MVDGSSGAIGQVLPAPASAWTPAYRRMVRRWTWTALTVATAVLAMLIMDALAKARAVPTSPPRAVPTSPPRAVLGQEDRPPCSPAVLPGAAGGRRGSRHALTSTVRSGTGDGCAPSAPAAASP